MAKVMLVIDDYNELEFIETLLKRVGFDVLSLNKDASVADTLLGFFPALVVATLKGPLIDGLKTAALAKKQAPSTKVMLLYGKGAVPQLTGEQKTKIDALIEAPVQPQDTLLIIAQLLRMDAPALLDKFEKLSRARHFERGADVVLLRDEKPKGLAGPDAEQGDSISPRIASGDGRVAGPEAAAPKTEREKRYDAFLAEHDEPVDRVIPHERMLKDVQELTDAAKGEEKALAELGERKKEFVRALMKKAGEG